MTKALVLLIGLALAGVAQAQIKCWTGANGKRACGDVPPPGAKLETPRGAPAPQEAPRAATDAKQGIPASTPQAQEIRKSQGEAEKTNTNMTMRKVPATGNPQECERARELLGAMGGGGRSKRTDAAKARALYQNNCPP
jgi:hypothetical protein